MKLRYSILLVLLILFGFSLQAQISEVIAQGFQKLEAKDYAGAAKLFDQALKEQPRDTSALSGIIRAYLLTENLKEAQRFIDFAIKEHPSNSEFYLRRGILNNMKGQFRRAIDDFDKAIDFIKGNTDLKIQIHINRGVANIQDENYSQAYTDFSDALNINPRNPSALNYRAMASYRMGNFSESINDYNKAIDLNPESPMSYYNRGMSHFRSGDKSKACADFHQACSKGNVNACRMIMTECAGVKN
jgi:tetratricopeptide (TPR) repeat protein